MKTHLYSFEKLEAWKYSKGLVVQVYKHTSGFPDTEKFGLVTQLRRSAVSICSNIAEGSGRPSKEDRARFYAIAYSSLLELLNQTIIAYDLDLITETDYNALRLEIQRVSFFLQRLHQSQSSKDKPY